MKSETGDRRKFFRSLARDVVVNVEEAMGRPHARLSALFDLPTEALAVVRPKILPGVRILPDEAMVKAILPGKPAPFDLFLREEPDLSIFNRFNGQTAIGRMAAELAAANSWPPEQAAARVRDLFFKLVRLGVCVPANSPDEIPGFARKPSP